MVGTEEETPVPELRSDGMIKNRNFIKFVAAALVQQPSHRIELHLSGRPHRHAPYRATPGAAVIPDRHTRRIPRRWMVKHWWATN